MFKHLDDRVIKKVLVRIHKDATHRCVDSIMVEPKWCTGYLLRGSKLYFIKTIDLIKQGFSIDEVYLVEGGCIDGERIFGYPEHHLDIMVG